MFEAAITDANGYSKASEVTLYTNISILRETAVTVLCIPCLADP